MKYLKTITELLESKYPEIYPTGETEKKENNSDLDLIDIVNEITNSFDEDEAFEYLDDMDIFLSYVDAGKVDIWIQKNKSKYPKISSNIDLDVIDTIEWELVKKLTIFAKAEVLLDFEYLDQMKDFLSYVDAGKTNIWFQQNRDRLSDWLTELSTQDFRLDDSDLLYMGLGPSGSNNGDDGRPKNHTKSGYWNDEQ